MYYGWIVLFIITCIEGLSGFGRTSALSPFVQDLCSDLCLTATELSGAYALSNLFAGFCLPLVGRFYDRRSSEYFLKVFVLTFSGSLIGLGCLNFLHWSRFVNFCCFLFGFFVIRTSLHAYTVVGRSMTATWFDKNRGLATGLSCFLLSTIASSMPWINCRLHKFYDWYTIWFVVGIAWLLLLWICPWVRKNSVILPSEQKHQSVGKAWRKRPVFWFISFVLFFKAFQNTGIAFHLIPICEELNAPSEKIAFTIIIVSLVTTLTTFVIGHLFNRLGAKCVLFLFLISDIVFLWALRIIYRPEILPIFVLCTGFYWGLNQVVVYMVVPYLFGTKDIGEINGFTSSCISVGSAAGPFVIGFTKDCSSYYSAISWCLYVAIFLFGIGAMMQKQIRRAGV